MQLLGCFFNRALYSDCQFRHSAIEFNCFFLGCAARDAMEFNCTTRSEEKHQARWSFLSRSFLSLGDCTRSTTSKLSLSVLTTIQHGRCVIKFIPSETGLYPNILKDPNILKGLRALLVLPSQCHSQFVCSFPRVFNFSKLFCSVC